jgi:nitrite reductase/ring-hydroxylating ferredoxin subunit
MGSQRDRSSSDGPVFDPRTTPIPRRSMLALMGVGALSAAGLATILEGCATLPPVTVALDVDVAALPVGSPTEVAFTMSVGQAVVDGSTWLVKRADGDLIAFDPRCTHALCAYRWSDDTDRFQCGCHDGRFALDGTVLAGPPPRALDRFPIRETATGIEIDVPASFAAPKASLG